MAKRRSGQLYPVAKADPDAAVPLRLATSQVEGLEHVPADRWRDHRPEPHLGPRLVLRAVGAAPAHHLRGQGRVHGRLEDQVPLPGHGHDPDRPLGRQRRERGARHRGRHPRRGRAVRHLPRGHPVARRHAAQGPHRCRPARPCAPACPIVPVGRAGHRSRSCPPDAKFPKPFQQGAHPHRPADRRHPLPRPRRRPHGAAPDHRRGDVRDPAAVGSGVRRTSTRPRRPSRCRPRPATIATEGQRRRPRRGGRATRATGADAGRRARSSADVLRAAPSVTRRVRRARSGAAARQSGAGARGRRRLPSPTL